VDLQRRRKFADISQKWQSCLGGWRAAPSAQSVPVTDSLDVEDICLHNCMWTKFVGVQILRGEVFKYLSKFFGKIWSNLGGWFSATPANIKILTPAWQVGMTHNISRRQSKFLSLRGSRYYCAPRATQKNGEIFLGTPPVPPFKFYGPMFCQVMGPIGLCHAEKFQCSLTPKGGDMGVKIFFCPLPPQNSLVRPPQNYVVTSAFMSPTNPENLVRIGSQIFLSAHLKIWGPV